MLMHYLEFLYLLIYCTLTLIQNVVLQYFACIDVYDMEPPIPEDYPLLNAKNTILTPHQAFISEEAMERRAKIVFDNVVNWLDGNPINVCR